MDRAKVPSSKCQISKFHGAKLANHHDSARRRGTVLSSLNHSYEGWSGEGPVRAGVVAVGRWRLEAGSPYFIRRYWSQVQYLLRTSEIISIVLVWGFFNQKRGYAAAADGRTGQAGAQERGRLRGLPSSIARGVLSCTTYRPPTLSCFI